MKYKKYKEFIEAVALEYLDLTQDLAIEKMRQSLNEYSAMGRLVNSMREMPDSSGLIPCLQKELAKVKFQEALDYLDAVGVKDAFEDHGEDILRYFRWTDVPKEDLSILQNAAIKDPESLMKLVEFRAHKLAEEYIEKKFSIQNTFDLVNSVLSEKDQQSDNSKKKVKKPRKMVKRLIAYFRRRSGRCWQYSSGNRCHSLSAANCRWRSSDILHISNCADQ